ENISKARFDNLALLAARISILAFREKQFQYRLQSPPFLLRRYLRLRSEGRLCTDVDDVGAIFNHLQNHLMKKRMAILIIRCGKIFPSIRKRIRRDIQNAHQQRSVEGELHKFSVNS